MQFLIYDDKEMHVYDVVNYVPQPVGHTEFDVTMLEDNLKRVAIIPNSTYTAELTTGEKKAELDPTTMKRIAKYNLDKEFWEINDKINKAHEELLRLDKEVEERREKILLMDNLIEMIWGDEDFDEDKYLPDDEEDY